MMAAPFPHARRSSALVVVLAAVAFLSLIVVALTVGMKMESQEAHYYAARTAADLLARNGVEAVRASLLAATTNGVWASGPGVAVGVTNGKDGGKAAAETIPLVSTLVTNGTGIYAPPDLNRAVTTDDGQRLITGPLPGGSGGTLAMRVGWIYVFQDGTVTTNQTPTLTDANPVVGRFAYWADDESARINVNTARGKTDAALTPSHPSRIGLDGLFGTRLANLVAGQATNYPFASADMVRLVTATASASDLPGLVSSNRFSLTASSFSPNLNPLGQPKILLTTQAALTNGTGLTNFLDILSKTNADPGPMGNVDAAKLSNVVSNLTALLSTNLPPYGTSFAAKYTAYSPTRIAQVALDIVEYVRSAESTNAVVEPVRASWKGTVFDINTYEVQGTFIGNTRHPVLTQMAVWMTNAVVTSAVYPNGYRPALAELVLYLPPNYGLDSYELTGGRINLQTILDGNTAYPPLPDRTGLYTNINITNVPVSGSYAKILAGNPLTPGSTCVIAAPFAYTNTADPPKTYPLRAYFKATGPSGFPYELAPLIPGQTVAVPVTVGAAPPTAGSSLPVVEVGDPRVNKTTASWKTVPGTLGSPSLALTATNVFPPQDTDSGGNVSAVSLAMPKPKGTTGARGYVGSVAELGYISTGGEQMAGLSTHTVPWRTLRFQPNSGLPPDWTLLDFFAAPISSNDPSVYFPQAGTVAGRISLNSGLPFPNNPAVVRPEPLLALFRAAGSALTNNPGVITNQVAALTLAAGGTNYGVAAYLSPGELAEVAGVADGGEATEANLQGVVDLATTQGSVFRVYALGQALQQTPGPNRTLVVLSEQYKEAILSGYRPRTGPSTLLWKSLSP